MTHEVAPAPEEDPAAQLVQALAPAVEYEPDAHDPDTAVRPDEEQKLPDGQLVHAEMLEEDDNVPISQARQVVAVTAENFPAPHKAHAELPVLDWNWPAAHDVHAADPALAANWPAKQEVQDADEEAPVALKKAPAKHLVQLV